MTEYVFENQSYIKEVSQKYGRQNLTSRAIQKQFCTSVCWSKNSKKLLALHVLLLLPIRTVEDSSSSQLSFMQHMESAHVNDRSDGMLRCMWLPEEVFDVVNHMRCETDVGGMQSGKKLRLVGCSRSIFENKSLGAYGKIQLLHSVLLFSATLVSKQVLHQQKSEFVERFFFAGLNGFDLVSIYAYIWFLQKYKKTFVSSGVVILKPYYLLSYGIWINLNYTESF